MIREEEEEDEEEEEEEFVLERLKILLHDIKQQNELLNLRFVSPCIIVQIK
jgi:hypothetical protein